MPEGPHNMFLAMMVDYGIVGLIAYLVIIIRLILIVRGADRKISGTILFFVAWLVIFSFASHNLLGNTATIPLMGFALARAYQIQYSRRGRQIEQWFRRR
jgi:O-antigen ligase